MGSPVDVEGLFKKFTVTEVNEIERKLKSDVERKKEDLRQMVGRRYRDIIEAADSIRLMKEDADTILATVRNVQHSVDSLQQIQQRLVASQARAIRVSASRNSLSVTTVTSLYFRLYEDLCEMIWDCLDEEELLEAAWLHTFGGWLYDQLCLRDLTRHEKQVVGERRAKHDQFTGRIIEKSLAILRCSSVKSELRFEHAICALVILKQMTLENVMRQLLNERLESVNSCFRATDQSSRQQIANGVVAVMSTLAQVKALFFPDLASGNKTLIYEQIYDIASQKYRSGKLLKFLHRNGGYSYDQLFMDSDTRNGSPLILAMQKLSDVTAGDCVEVCNDFVARVGTALRLHLKASLGYFATADGLTNLKLEILKIMQESFNASEWQNICDAVLGKPLDVWNEMLADLLNGRMKEISREVVQSHFDELLDGIRTSVSTSMSSKLNADMSKSLDSARDTFSMRFGDFLWSPLSREKEFTSVDNTSDLKLRSCGYDPAVYKWISKFDGFLSGLRSSVVGYIHACVPGKSNDSDLYSVNVLSKSTANPPRGGNDLGGLWSDLKESCERSLNKFCEDMTSLITELQQLSSQQNDFDYKRVVFCGKALLCLADLSPELQKTLFPPSSQSSSKSQVIKMDSRASRESSEEPANSGQRGGTPAGAVNNWLQVARPMLVQTASKAFSVWIEVAVPRLTNILMNPSDLEVCFESIQEWECIEIADEGTDGAKSKFYLPTQVSYRIHGYLMAVCHELDAIGLHALPKNVHEKFVAAVGKALLDHYSSCLDQSNQSEAAGYGAANDTRLSPKRALHVVFELQVVQVLFGISKSSKPIGECYSTILTGYESLADPFDLDMLYAHNKKNVKRFVHKSTQLYGALMVADAASSLLRTALPKSVAGAGAQEQPQLVPLRTGVKRFQTLAIPSHLVAKYSTASKSRAGTEVGKLLSSSLQPNAAIGGPYSSQSTIAQASRGVASGSNASLTAALLQKSSSFYDKISTGWFGM